MENLTAKNSFTILIPKHLMLQPSLSTSIIQASWDPNNNHSNFSPYCGERVGNSLLTRGGLQGLVKMSSSYRWGSRGSLSLWRTWLLAFPTKRLKMTASDLTTGDSQFAEKRIAINESSQLNMYLTLWSNSCSYVSHFCMWYLILIVETLVQIFKVDLG